MVRRVKVHGVRREFDTQRYAAVVIALAKYLVEQDDLAKADGAGDDDSEREVPDER